MLHRPPAPVLPGQSALDGDLRSRRLALVRWYSLGIAVVGSLWFFVWCAAFLAYAERPSTVEWLATASQSILLGGAGWYALYRTSHGRLRRATYTNVAALILAATINLAFIRNAEGSAIVMFTVAMSLAALVLEGREWLWLGGALGVSALAGTLLHFFPVGGQVELPPRLAIGSLLCAATMGLAFPMGFFWFFSANLTASRSEAWDAARHAADAERLATERAEQLEQRTEQLQAKNAEMNDFLYVVSHDLRAPLINLEGFSRALQDGMTALAETPAHWEILKPDIDESLDFILRSVAKMDFLVQGLLELSRIDSRPQLAQAVDLRAIVGAAVDSLRFSIDARGIALHVDPLPVVTGDPVRISQVFSNLIDNAVKYAKPNGDAQLHIGCEPRGSALHCFVRDNGIGIRREDQAKIFRLFGRVGGHGVAGDGMGLTAVKKILEKHGGKIWVESALGEGSTFWFTLPRPATAEREDGDDGTATVD
ncbi:MAG: sensor histidine kinase [Candidatus Binatia bacterium]